MHSFSSDCIAFGRKPISVISSITASVSGGESGWLIACIIRASCSGSMPVPAGSWPPPGISDRIRAIISSEPGPPGREAAHSRQPGMPGWPCRRASAASPCAAGHCGMPAACRARAAPPGIFGQAAAEQACHPGAAPPLAQVERLQARWRCAMPLQPMPFRVDRIMSLSIDWARP
jgi:hypothetical protein